MKSLMHLPNILRLALITLFALAVVGCAAMHQAQQPAPAPEVAASQPVESAPPPPTPEPAAPVEVALALPLSGPYGVIASKISQGGEAGRNTLQQRGQVVNLHIIDTDKPDWLQQLQQLPDSVKIVGGPLRPDRFANVVQSGLNKKLAFFTFLQDLGNAAEGRDAWRFFSSPYDQMRTLLQMARKEFSIYNVGVLYPEEPFGKRIVQLFLEEAKKEGINVSAMQSYPPEDPLRWSEIVAALLYSNKEAPIDAVFLPDVWSKAEMLVPYIFYHQREDLIIMGSTLWGQTLTKERNVDIHNFRLSIFPATWWSEGNTMAARELRKAYPNEEPNFWEVLGFDFVRFATRMNSLPAAWTPEQVNQHIRSAQNLEWSMAPISWSDTGIAKQDMFLFTPSNGGMRPADMQDMRQRRQAVKARLQY